MVLIAVSGPSQADPNPLLDIGDLHATWNGTIGIGAFAVPQANFGAGSYETDKLLSKRTSPVWGEGFVKPQIGLNYDVGTLQFAATFSTIYAQTIGDGDASLVSTTRGAPGQIDLEEANVEITGALPALESGTFDLQLGRQNFLVDDGFLIADGTINAGTRAAYYLVPRNVFDGIGVLHLNGMPVRADIFVLSVDTAPNLTRRGLDQPPTSFAGFDLTWFANAPGDKADGSKNYADRLRYVTTTYFHIYDSKTDGTKTSRDGMDVYSLSVGGAPAPSVPDFTFYAQAVLERNASPHREVRANAYYVQPEWTFSDLPLTPAIFYCYSHYSGARSPNDATNENYDPLFYGAGYRGGNFGSYYYGEILSEYFIANTNVDIHEAELTLMMPFHVLNDQDSLKLDFIYYRYLYDQKRGLALSSDSLGQEVNIAAEYQYSPATSLGAAVGVATPGSGAKEQLAQQLNLPSGGGGQFNRASGIAEVFATFSF
jgi:hypothetical protein